MGKGSGFERELCRRLSLWASGGKDDDWFWRSSQSGGRATTRFRKGKTTRGHCGDICATSKDGEWLTTLVTFEAKRGYNRVTPADVFDRPPRLKQQGLEAFFEQAMTAAGRAGTAYWMVIHRRSGREPVVYFPQPLYFKLVKRKCRFAGPVLKLRAGVKLGTGKSVFMSVVGMTLEGFLDGAPPATVRRLADSHP